jgi:hypothetical protein
LAQGKWERSLEGVGPRELKSSPGEARTKMLAGVPGKDDMWKTTEYTEKRRFSSVYSVYSVVSTSRELASTVVAAWQGRCDTKTKSINQPSTLIWPTGFKPLKSQHI